jgi:hypothetical protein
MITALVLSLSVAQLTPEQLARVNTDRNHANQQGMSVLIGWGVASMAVGGAGWMTSNDKEWQAFHMMNFLVGVVDAGLGVAGLLQAFGNPRALDLEASRAASQSNQVTYLVNVGLDVAYTVLGAILLKFGHTTDSWLLRGWGKSLLIQGIFLVLFDSAMFIFTNTVGAPLRAGTPNVL